MSIFKRLIIFVMAFLCVGCTQKQDRIPKLTYSTWGSHSEMSIIKPLIKEFEQKNNVKIKLIHIPQNYFQKLHILFASKQAPDVLFINNYYLPLYAKAGLLENLEKYFSLKELENTFFQNTLNSMKFENTLYGLPRDVSNLVIFYNQDMFKRKKIPYPTKNWNYQDLLKLAKQLTDDDTLGIGFEEKPIFWEPILWSNGGELFNKKGEFTLNQKESLDALKYYIDLRINHKVAPSKTESSNRTMAQLFLNEKIAMHISGRWLVPKYRAEANFNWDIIPLPNGKKGSIAGSDTSGWAISKSSKNKDLAINFIKYMSSYESIQNISKSGLITPARKDCAYSNTFLDKNKKPQNAIFFIEINDLAKNTNIPNNYNQKIEKLERLLEPYFLGKEKISPYTKFEL